VTTPGASRKGQLIIALAAEGGGVDLYQFEDAGQTRFTWDGIFGPPNNRGVSEMVDGAAPTRTFVSVSEAMQATYGYWPLLAPFKVDHRYRELFLTLLREKLPQQRVDSRRQTEIRARWERACAPLPAMRKAT
jgi:hypothetical protein